MVKISLTCVHNFQKYQKTQTNKQKSNKQTINKQTKKQMEGTI